MGFSMIAALGEKNDNKVPEIKMININDLVSDIQNFYRVSGDEDIEKQNELLFADVLERGIESPIIVKQLDNGKFQIISGHRRREICYRLVSEGHDKFQFIPAIISQVNSEEPNEINEVKNEINLIMSNVTSRELNDWEKVQQVTRLDALYKQLKASGEKTSGRIDELIAEKLNISKSAVGRAKNIDKNLSDDYKKELEKGKLSIAAANKLASKPKEEQEKLHEENPTPKVSDLEKPQSLLPTAPEPPKTDKPYNGNGVYYDEYCKEEKLDIPKKYKMSMTIIIAHDTEDDKYRFGLRIADKTSGRSNPPCKTAAGYQTKQLAREVAIKNLAFDDTRKKALIEAGYIEPDQENTESTLAELEEQGQQTMGTDNKMKILPYKKIPSYDGYVGGTEKENISFSIGHNENTNNLFAYILVDNKSYMVDLNMVCQYVKECIQSGAKL